MVWVRVLQRNRNSSLSKAEIWARTSQTKPTWGALLHSYKGWVHEAVQDLIPACCYSRVTLSVLCATPSPTPCCSLEALDLMRTPLRRGVHCCLYTATLFYLPFEERNLWVATSLKSILLAIPNCLYFTACTKSFHASVPLFMLFLPLGMPIFLCLGLTLPLL